MARYQKKSTARSIRKDNIDIPESMPATHRVWLALVLDAAIHAGHGVYVSQWYRTGKAVVRFYIGDDPVETFITHTDNPRSWAVDTADAIFTAGLAKEVIARGDAVGGQAGPGATKSLRADAG